MEHQKAKLPVISHFKYFEPEVGTTVLTYLLERKYSFGSSGPEGTPCLILITESIHPWS